MSNTNLLILDGNFTNVSAVATALQASGSRAITFTGTRCNLLCDRQFIVVWSDGTHIHAGFYTISAAITGSTRTISAGSLTQVAQLSGITSTSSFVNANFAYTGIPPLLF